MTVSFTGMGRCVKGELDFFSGLGRCERGGGFFSFLVLRRCKKELLAEVDLGGLLYTSGWVGAVGEGRGGVNGGLEGERAEGNW